MFTVPLYRENETLIRAIRDITGIKYLQPAIYHGNPIDEKGALVTREWGYDICEYIYKKTGMLTTVINLIDKQKGIEGEFLDIFISRKLPAFEKI